MEGGGTGGVWERALGSWAQAWCPSRRAPAAPPQPRLERTLPELLLHQHRQPQSTEPQPEPRAPGPAVATLLEERISPCPGMSSPGQVAVGVGTQPRKTRPGLGDRDPDDVTAAELTGQATALLHQRLAEL